MRQSRVTVSLTLVAAALATAGLVSAQPAAAATPASAAGPVIFHPPVRLQADGKDIDVGKAWGHAGPCLADVDGDGLRDLVVGDYRGLFRFFRNAGSNSQPRYAAAVNLKGGSVDAKVPIYCCIGSSPTLADLDGDGTPDLISGSYDPGECYWFRGLGDGSFAARETIVDKSGKPVLRVPDQQQDYESFGSWPLLVDWDNDGDRDLLVGGFDGTMFVRLNEAQGPRPEFSTTNLQVQADGQQLKLPDTSHAAPAIVDWDNDGRRDILSGSENGAVFLYRNTGEPGKPAFAAPEMLIPKHSGSGYNELIEVGAEPVPGIRTQIAACDYNDDGKVDLLVGDFCTNLTPRPDLTADERNALQTLFKEIDEAGEARGKLFKALQDDFHQRYPGDAIFSDQADKEWAAAYRAMHDSEEYKQLAAQGEALNKSVATYLQKPPTPGAHNEMATCHGYVWLFLRQ